MTVPAIKSALQSGIRSAIQGAVQGKRYSPLYNIKANPNTVALPHFKKELVYNASDWREWTKPAGVVGDSTGLEWTADGTSNLYVPIATKLKTSTNYGFLYNVVSSTVNGSRFIFDVATDISTPIAISTTVGNVKTTFVTKSSIIYNRCLLTYTPDTAGNKLKIKDFRIFELPVGSEIAADFAVTGLSADALMIKYAPTNFTPGELKATVLGRTLDNKLNYTPETWAEWTITGAGSTKGATGVHLVAAADTEEIYIPTACKAATKYLLLYNVPATDLDNDLFLQSFLTGGDAIALPKLVGNNKYSFTTQNPIATNYVDLFLGSVNTDGKYINLKDLRLLECPTDSEIELDATNMTADQLALKYPMAIGVDGKTGGVNSVGSRQATNLVTNGNFAQGTTGWTAGNCGTPTVANNVCTFTATAQYGNINRNIDIPTVTGHKYYIGCKMQGANSCVYIQLKDGNGREYYTLDSGYQRVSKIFTETSGGTPLLLVADNRESDWTPTSIKEILAIDLTATFGAGLEPDLATCDRLFADWFDGSKSVTQLRSVGKNLFDKSKVAAGYYVDRTTGNLVEYSSFSASNFIKAKPSTRYSCVTSASGGDEWAYYDGNKVFLSGCVSGSSLGNGFTTPINTQYVRISVINTILNTCQLEESPVATPYEPYRSQTCLVPDVLRSVGSVADSFSSDGALTKRIGSKVLVAGDVYNALDNGTNRTIAQISSNIFASSINWVNPGTITMVMANGASLREISLSNWDVASSDYTFATSAADLYVFFPKGIYATFADIQAAFAGASVYYNINPTTKTYNLAQLGCSGLKEQSGGTLYVEKITGDAVEVVPNVQLQYERSV